MAPYKIPSRSCRSSTRSKPQFWRRFLTASLQKRPSQLVNLWKTKRCINGKSMKSTICSISDAEKVQVGYLAQHPLFDQMPELRMDKAVLEYCVLEEDKLQSINAWLGLAGTVSIPLVP
ncbi:hypothetical protein WJX74_001952 [Apatococcus lobatus]|uniref:Uncharacterized protein n=1 Tax=Apatococcus lobatus TaxID=904363 RepID=A0AAW1RAH2_9CHLO